MKLSKQTSDAVSILLYCKRSGEPLVKVAHIAEQLGLTKQMALKLSNRLARADLLMTVRGPKGGVQLTELAETLPLGQIIRRLEAVLYSGEDVAQSTPFDTYFDQAFDAFLDVLDQHRLEDLAVKRQPKRKATKRQTKGQRSRTSQSKSAAASQAVRRGTTDIRDQA